MKKCTVCKEEKEEYQFWKDRSQKSGLRSDCINCGKKKSADQRIKHIDRIKKKSRERYHANPLPDREKHLKRKYGIDQARYQEMFDAQNGKCAICRKQQEKAFDVDHCHKTGGVRGLLCTSCNRMLGHAGDRPEVLDWGRVYLLSFRKSPRNSSKRACK